MDFCSHCLSPLKSGDRKCPECGLSTSGEDADILLRDREERSINLQLARINLLRIRGQRREAINICEEILKYHPENADALAVRGDLAFDEGNLNEASRWYRTAADAAPGKLVYQQRLQDVMAEVDRRSQIQEHENTMAMLSRRTRNYRLFGIIMGVGLLLTLVMLSQVIQPSKQGNIRGQVSISKHNTAPPSPTNTPDGTSPEVVLNTPPTADIPDMTPEELGMMEVVNGVLAAHTEMVARSAHYDPVLYEAGLTAVTSKQVSSEEAMRLALLAAKSVVERWNGITRVRIRIIVAPNASERYLAFSGGVTRAEAATDTKDMTVQQLSALFSGLYIK